MGRRKTPEQDLDKFWLEEIRKVIRNKMLQKNKKPSNKNCPRCEMPMEHCGKGRRSIEICNFCDYRC